jgi:hypothetical protein
LIIFMCYIYFVFELFLALSHRTETLPTRHHNTPSPWPHARSLWKRLSLIVFAAPYVVCNGLILSRPLTRILAKQGIRPFPPDFSPGPFPPDWDGIFRDVMLLLLAKFLSRRWHPKYLCL